MCPLIIATTGASTDIQGDPSPVNSSSNASTPPPPKPSGYPLTQSSGQNLVNSLNPHLGADIIMTSTPDLTGVGGCGGSNSSLGNGGSGSPILLEPHNNNTQSIADYLAQLLKDKKQLAAFPNVFLHVERLLDDGKLLMMQTIFSTSFIRRRKNVGLNQYIYNLIKCIDMLMI